MGRRIWGLGLVAAVAATVSVLACRQLVGITDNPPEDLVTSICGLPYGTNVCASCVNTNCCSESTACAADPACAAYEGCLGDCTGDLKCRAQCAIDHPVGPAMDISALSVCLATHCEDTCGLTCGALAGVQTEPAAAVACGACLLATNACAVEEACARSIDCDTINRCALACPTADCKEACLTEHGLTIDFGISINAYGISADAGTSPYPALANVVQGTCATACDTGGYWECVGKVSWPSPKTTTSTIHFWSRDLSSSSAIPGTQVSVCSALDVGCNAPLQTGTTNDAGEVSLTFANRDPYMPGVGLTGYLTFSAMDSLPGQVYWGFPLSEADYFTYDSTLTPANWHADIQAIGVTLDAARSAAVVVVFDCLGNQASGVTVTLDTADKETVSFTSGGIATSTTGSDGTLTFFNVPTGHLRATATPMAIQRPSSVVDVTVEGEAGIGGPTVYMAPTPMQ